MYSTVSLIDKLCYKGFALPFTLLLSLANTKCQVIDLQEQSQKTGRDTKAKIKIVMGSIITSKHTYQCLLTKLISSVRRLLNV